MTVREAALRKAIGELGVHEEPSGSNSGPRVRQYQAATSLGGTGWPWCMAFVCWCYKQAGHKLPYPTASVGYFVDWARTSGVSVTRPFRGDIVCYRFDADNWPDHTGIVERVLAIRGKVFWVRTIEGNTSLTSNDNGGKVMRRTRWHRRCSYVRIAGQE